MEARDRAGVMIVSFEYANLVKRMNGIGADMRVAGPAIEKAHKKLAQTLQRMIAAELISQVEGKGRAQRRSLRDGPLARAIRSNKNRTVDTRGFTVGFLDDKGKFPKVVLYAKGLEEGTYVHVGQYMFGLWVTANGLEQPIVGANNAIGFRPGDRIGNRRDAKERPAIFRIKRPIHGYHYQRRGFNEFEQAGFTGAGAIAVYADAFSKAHLNFAAELMRASGIRAGTNLRGVGSAIPDLPDSEE